MQRLEVSGVVQPIYGLLGVKRISRKKNSHNLWGPSEKVSCNSDIVEWWVPDMTVCIHDNETVLFSQLKNLLQLDNVTVQNCIQRIIRLVFWYKITCSMIRKVVVTCVLLFQKSWVSLCDVRLPLGHSYL